MKKLSKMIAFILSLTMLVTLAACGDETPPAQAALTGIEIATAPTKTNYVVGDMFNPSGMAVTALYDDGEKKTVSDYSYSPAGALTAEHKEIVITYKEKTAKVSITVVEKAVSSIEITDLPAKTAYVEGEIFDKTGMKVTARYNDGSSMEITDYTVTPSNALTADVTKVTVKYLEKSATVDITVAAKTVASIAITSAPAKTTYVEGQSFSTKGMVVKAAYSDGSSSPVIGYTVSPAGALTMGTREVTVSFGGKSAVQSITVIEKMLESIAVTKVPDRTLYIEGENFDKTGMEVSATYNDESTVEVSDYTVDKTALTLADTFVTVSYNGKTANLPIEVSKPLERISISKAPEKLEYIEGQKFASAGMEITAHFTDNTAAVVTRWTVEDKVLEITDTAVTVGYLGKSAEQAITVIAKEVSEIAVTKNPEKTSYIVGQTFDVKGMEITATYNDGDTKVIALKAGDKDGYTVTDTALVAGDNTITIAYRGKEKTLTVKAQDVVSISVTTSDAFKTAYVEGETFDTAGLTVTATLTDESAVVVAYDKTGVNGYTYAPNEALTGGTTKVTISFKGKTADLSITVKSGFSIEAENAVLISKDSQSLKIFDDNKDAASGGFYVGEVRKGDKIRFDFTASAEGTAFIYFRAASGDVKTWGENWAPVEMNDVALKDAIGIKLNGKEFTVPENAVLKGGKSDNPKGDAKLWYSWAQVRFDDMAVVSGVNTFEITFEKGMNVDSAKVLFDGDVKGSAYVPAYTVKTVGGGTEGAPRYVSETLTKNAFEFETVNSNPDKWKNQTSGSASGGGFIDNLDGGHKIFSFKINMSEKDTNAVIDLVGACANYVWNGETNSGGNVSKENIGSDFDIRINGQWISLEGLKLICKNAGDWTNWTSIVVEGIALEKGENTIEVRRLNGYPNLDVLNVWTSVPVTPAS